MPLSSVSENRCGDDGGSDERACGELRRIAGVGRVVDGERGRFSLRGTVGDDCIVRQHRR
jgi:hypothetical protein